MSKITIPIKPVLGSPIRFLINGNNSEPMTPTIAEAPTNTPKTHSVTHCDKQNAYVILSKPRTVMYRNDNPKPALRIEWVIYSDQPCVTAFMRFHTKAQHFEDSLDEFSVVSLILKINRFTHKKSTHMHGVIIFTRL